MLMLERGFYVYMMAQPTITAIIGNRLYPESAPQSATFPYMVYSRANVDSHYMFLGPSATLTTSLVLECYELSKSPMGVKRLAYACRQVLDGFVGFWDEVEIDGVFILDEEDGREAPKDGSDQMVYSVALMLDIWHARETSLFLS